MMDWQNIIFILGAILLVWVIIHMIRSHPQHFTSHHMGKSIYTLGWITLILIVVIAIGIFIMRY